MDITLVSLSSTVVTPGLNTETLLNKKSVRIKLVTRKICLIILMGNETLQDIDYII